MVEYLLSEGVYMKKNLRVDEGRKVLVLKSEFF